mgnify:CR=1 FL=1
MSKAKLVEVLIPRGGKNEDPNVFVAINGKTWLLPRGKTSLVPPEVAAELARAQMAQDRLDEYVAQNARVQ